MVMKIPHAVTLSLLLANVSQAFASSDMEGCKWSDDACLLKGDPVLGPDSGSHLLSL
ncbi:hypothetical protein [Franconibacter helveticus]|uniref:hypothetical protein n=1 Tax=Franconibacter helveticus TaxID=357240 RepID=UPI00290EC305|nr:hypothetical protein [Franconibacter helveticus]MDU6926240.1 hypothetical protein [Franconibacter helveticus]